MGKDPAFLFYSADFLTGTHFFSNSETGAYIRILCHMADKGPLKEAQIKSLCGETGLTENLKSKLKKDKNGWYYQERLFEELEKRRKFCESRRASRTSNVRRTYVERTENENRNENKDENEIRNYFNELKFPLEADAFIDHFKSNGWKVGGKAPMKDWRAAARNWVRRNHKEVSQPSKRDIQRQRLKEKLVKFRERQNANQGSFREGPDLLN